MKWSLDGKTALVTGGSRGIGRSIALELADLGANVAITYASSAKAADNVREEIVSKDRRAKALQADAVNYEKAEEVIAGITGDWEKLDILVNKDRKSTRLNSRHVASSYAVICLKKKKKTSCTSTNRPTINRYP